MIINAQLCSGDAKMGMVRGLERSSILQESSYKSTFCELTRLGNFYTAQKAVAGMVRGRNAPSIEHSSIIKYIIDAYKFSELTRVGNLFPQQFTLPCNWITKDTLY